jgi:glycosyltransferase involved in cell wall biosynthesis
MLEAAVRSVLNQTYQDFEIVVVDDASNDDTEQVVRSIADPRIRYIAHKANRRVGAARNTGVRHSKGELIAFLDDDDEWLSEKLEKQVALLDSCSGVTGVIYTGCQKFDRTTGQLLATVTPSNSGHILHELCQRNCVGTASTVLLRRRCLDEVGFFDEAIDFGEEYDMWIRISHSYDFRFLPEPLVRYSVHEDRLSRSYGTMIRGLAAQLAKYEDFFGNYPELMSRRLLTLGALCCHSGDIRRGRAAFRRAIRVRPFGIKTYMYLCLSLFGATIFRVAREPLSRSTW